MYKVGYVSIVGKPNVGKSTLINKLVGFKVAITTSKPQTTRYNIKGIVTTKTSQIIFIDTPGIHMPENELGKKMMDGVNVAVKENDLLLYLVDAVKPKIDDSTLKIFESISKLNKKVVLAINKIDKNEKEKILKIIDMYVSKAKEFGFEFIEIIPISIYKNDGLDILLKVLEDNLEEGEKIYSDDEFTDMTEREIAEEVVREKILTNLDEEVPHGVNVIVDSFKERVNENGKEVYDINASIICSKMSHKPIIIGSNGSRLNHIKNQSKIELEGILGVKINLKLFVKVRENWMENSNYYLNLMKFK